LNQNLRAGEDSSFEELCKNPQDSSGITKGFQYYYEDYEFVAWSRAALYACVVYQKYNSSFI
jgi:hypothetical protein